MTKIDLHTHSTASDGIYSPTELIDYAIANDVSVLALTDHDTVGGISAAIEYSQQIGYRFIPGIEFSIEYTGGTFHLVGLNIDHTDKDLLEMIEKLNKIRDNRAFRIIEDLQKHGISIPVEEVIEESGDGAIGRPHVARVMVKHGYAKDITEIFKNYLVKGKPGYVKKERIALSDAIYLIKKTGGIPIIAHPVTLNFSDFNEFENILQEFISQGVEGIEVFAALHSLDEVENFYKLAVKYNLIISGGSDFHGDKNEIIGTYNEGRPVPPNLVNDLYEYLKKRK